MKPRALVLAALLAIGAALADAPPAGVAWAPDWASAQRRARAEHKPILIDFRADWCPHCARMDRRVWVRPEVVALCRERAVCLRAEFEKSAPFPSRFGVDVVPWVVLADADGKVLGSLRGYQGPAQLQRLVDRDAR